MTVTRQKISRPIHYEKSGCMKYLEIFLTSTPASS